MAKLFLKIPIIFLVLLFLQTTIFAADLPPGGRFPPSVGGIPLPLSPTQKFRAEGLVGQIVTKILPLVLTIGGFITVIVIIISGIQFVLSSGNPEAATAAKNRLVYALVGFIIIVLAFAVLQIVNRIFLGTNIA